MEPLEKEYWPLPLQGRRERLHLYKWMNVEEEYVANKFDDERNGHDETWEDGLDSFWLRQIVQYLDRARLFLEESADTFNGDAKRELELRAQQALAKGFMTFKGCVESSIRVFGPLPAPGVSSGEIREWVAKV